MENIYNIFSKKFFQMKKIYTNDTSFIWKHECNLTSNLLEADIVITSILNTHIYTNELIILTTPCISIITELDNFYYMNLYNYSIYFNKNSLFYYFKKNYLRDYVCLTFYLTITLKDMTLEYANDYLNNIFLKDNFNNSSPSYAIVLMGLPRTYKCIYPFLYNEWIKDIHPDIYISTEETSTEEIQEIKNLYNPKYIYLSTPSELKEQVNKWNKRSKKINNYTNINKYRIYKLFNYMDVSIYDFIIVLRTDVTLLRMFDLNTFDKNTIYTKHDMISIVPSSLFKDYVNLNETLYDYHTIVDYTWPKTPWINEHKMSSSWIYTPENQLFQHIIKITNNHWKPHFIPFFIQYLYRDNSLKWMISYNL